MKIITDSAADFTREELLQNDITCVPMQVMFGQESFTAGVDLPEEAFWKRLLSGEIAKTSQPSPDAFHAHRTQCIRRRVCRGGMIPSEKLSIRKASPFPLGKGTLYWQLYLFRHLTRVPSALRCFITICATTPVSTPVTTPDTIRIGR